MHVVYVVSRFPFLRNTFVVRELDGLDAAGVDVELIALLRPEEGIRHASTERWVARLTPRPSLRACLTDLGWWLVRRPARVTAVAAAIARTNLLNGHRPGVGATALLLGASHGRRLRGRAGVHLHAHFEIPTDAVWVMHRLAGCPYSFTVHTDDAVAVPSIPRDAAAASFVATPSRHTAGRLRARVGDDVPIAVVRAALPVSRYRFRPRRIPDEGVVRAVCVAGLEAYKGHAVLLDALATGGLERVVLDVVGDGPLRSELEQRVARLGLSAQVRFRGPMTEDEIREVLDGADLFVLASVVDASGRSDNVPVALMEAMAAGVPVVASRLAGIPELVEDGVSGFLARAGDAADVARAIGAALAAGPDVLEMLARARATVEREFDLPASSARLAALLRGDLSVRHLPGVVRERSPVASGRDR